MISDSPFKPTDRILRQFAVLWVVFFGLLAARLEFRAQQPQLALVFAVLAFTVGPAGIIWPRTIRVIFVSWMALAYPIGWVVSRVVLGTIFFGLFTPVAWIFRITGRDVLGLRPQRAARTYWQTKPHGTDPSRYLRQY